MDHEDRDLSVVLFGNSSAVQFGDENLLFGQLTADGAEVSKISSIPKKISGRNVSVINILDLQDTELYLDTVDQDIHLISENEIPAFIFILQLRQLTDTDKVGLDWLLKKFGESVEPFLMILFTYEREEDCDTIMDDLKKNPVLEQLVGQCGDRYHTCSKSMNNQSEMRKLLEKIDQMVSENRQHRYTAEMFKTVWKKHLGSLEKTSKHDVRDEQDHNEEKEKLEILLRRLHLKGAEKQKLRPSDFLQITLLSLHSEEPCEEKDLVPTFLKKLLLMDYRTRNINIKKTVDHSQSETVIKEEDDTFDDFFQKKTESPDRGTSEESIHPVDVQMAVFLSSDSFLQQLIVTKLSQCQYALPLLVPSPFTGETEFPLWTFRQVRKTWKSTDVSGEVTNKSMSAAEAKTPMVAFLRLGAISSSKSQLMNHLINEKHNTFFHRHCPGSSRGRLLMDGVVEIAWYLPSEKGTDSFTDCVAFCNLHGDAATHRKQLEILTEMSTVNVVVLDGQDTTGTNKEILKKLYEDPKPLICLVCDDDSCVTGRKKTYKIGLKDRNQAAVSEELRDTINKCVSESPSRFMIEDVATHSGITTDENNPDCQKGKDAALQMLRLLEGKDVSTIKETFLPCQGQLWHEWCQKNKQQNQLQGAKIEKQKEQIASEMKKIRKQQKEKGLTDLMKLFIKTINSFSTSGNVMSYFLKWSEILLEKLNAETVSGLHHEYDEKWSKVLQLKKQRDKPELIRNQAQLESLSEKLMASTFGLEHILREMGQVYESFMSVQKGCGEEVSCFPKLAADILVSGHPLELMDGDAGHVPLIWVSAVLDELIKQLGDQRVFVLSVLGIQSSGKSTMLNAMFGLQFAVSAGRCTRGAFMQLVKVSEEMKEELKFDHILVVDTEGLRALEQAEISTRHHDNELATFVVGLGNLTLINIFGENPAEMQDILQIVVQAFMRMKKVRLRPSCMFVHQNTGDLTAEEKNMEGRRRLQEKLDEMTMLAAKEEDCDAECFSDVIAFDVQKDVKYFAHLWEGNPPMAPLNPSYSNCIEDLKAAILTKVSPSHTMTFSSFRTSLHSLSSALLHENFVFSFRNTLEISVYRKLETEYSKWTWNLRSAMLKTEEKLHNRLANGDLQVGEKDIVLNMKMTKERVTKSVKKYFEEEKEKEILIQWQNRFTTKITELYEDLVREAQQKFDKIVQQKETKEKMEKRKAEYEHKLFSLSKELALKLQKEEKDEETLQTEFDSLWRKWVSELTQNTPKIKDLDLWEDVVKILAESYERTFVQEQLDQKTYRRIPDQESYTDYITFKKKEKPLDEQKERRLATSQGGFLKNIWNKFNIHKKKKNPEADDLHPEEISSLTNFINATVEKTSEIMKRKQISSFGYSSAQVQEIIDCVKKKVNKYQTVKRRYVLKKEFIVDLCLFACELAEPRFVEDHKKFTRTNDPDLYLEDQKLFYYNVFRSFWKGATTTTIFGELICSKIGPSLLQAVYNQTAIEVASHIRSSSPVFSSNRSNLEKHILKSLAEEQNFEKYMEYIHHPKQFFKKFISAQAAEYIGDNTTVQTIFKDVLKLKSVNITKALREATEEVKKSRGNGKAWLQHFSNNLTDELNFTGRSCADDLEITDFDFLQETLNNNLTSVTSKLLEAGIRMEKFQKSPGEILVDHFCQCCWVQCPFCEAICTNTLKDHEGDHSVPFHRADGINGWRYRGTEDLSSDFCTTSVQSDKKFFPTADSKESVPFKRYRSAGGKYAQWSITPDSSELPYWKWFVYNFQKNLEERYRKKFQGRGEIPEGWRNYSREDAINSLENYI